MQISDSCSKSINSGSINKNASSLWSAKGLFDFFIINLLIMDIATASKIMGFGFYQSTGEFSCFYHLLGFLDNFFVRSIMFSLTYIYMNTLKSGFYASNGVF